MAAVALTACGAGVRLQGVALGARHWCWLQGDCRGGPWRCPWEDNRGWARAVDEGSGRG